MVKLSVDELAHIMATVVARAMGVPQEEVGEFLKINHDAYLKSANSIRATKRRLRGWN